MNTFIFFFYVHIHICLLLIYQYICSKYNLTLALKLPEVAVKAQT